jgi:hypothetical protein
MRLLQSSPRALRRWRLAGLVTSLLCCFGCGSISTSTFSYTLPADVPSLAGWEKSEARTELDRPKCVVEYQLFVRPERGATYEVIRYRITYADPAEGLRLGISSNERLQWDLNGHTLRRFELMPTAQGGHWEELSRGSHRYSRETGVILGLLGLHRELLFSRDARLR